MTSWSWVPLTTIPGLPHQLTANFPYRIWGTTWSCSSQKSKIIQAYNFHFNCNPPLPPKWLLLGPPMHVDPYSSQHPNAGTQHANVMYIKNVALILDSFDKKLVICCSWSSSSQWLETLDESRLAETAADVPVPETDAELIKVFCLFFVYFRLLKQTL